MAATPAGYQQLLRLANRYDGRRVWAIERTGDYGAGLTRSSRHRPSKSWSWTDPGEPPAVTAPTPTR